MNEKWAHLDIAPDQITAEFWISVLGDAKIPARIHPSDAVSYLGVSAFGCRVQVPEPDVERAREVLNSLEPAS